MISKISNDEVKIDKLGNKGRFLIEMKKNGFNIPFGIVLNSDIYDIVLKENNIDKSILKIINNINKNNVDKESKKILDLFKNIHIPKNIIDEINSYLDSNKKYAVRSSGTKEDLENFSFAGQYDTFLNVKINDIEKNIINCYKSMFSPIILSYLINNDISFNDLKMSVVIQEMVDSEYSGICFTVNPITGKDKEMLIEVSKGLGENIVSGKTAPEQYSYNWFYKKIVNKIDNNKILDDKNIYEYGNVFSNIAHYFGYPCDIEFGIKDNKLYILQARKITKIKYNGIKDMWSTADFKDGGVSASVCTPFMWSLYDYIWEYTLRKFIIDSKILKDNEMPKKLGKMFYGRCYWNMTTVKKAMSKVIGYKEREFDLEYGVKINYEGNGEVTNITPSSLIKIMKIAISQLNILKVRKENAENYKIDLLTKYNNYKSMYDNNNIKDIENTWYKLTKEVYLQSESTYFWQIFINTIHQSLYKDSLLKYVSESDYLSLLGSIDNISHLLPFYDMWTLSRKIKHNKKSFEYWLDNESKCIEKDLNKNNNYLNDMNEIINKYGYHSDKELDITYPCYYEDKCTLIDIVKEMIKLDDSFSPIEDKKNGTDKYNEILNNIESKVSKSKFKKINKKVKTMRNMLWWREEFRDISTRFYYILRIYSLKYAEYLKNNNVIDEIDDIWYLSINSLWNYIDNKKDANSIKEIVKRNKFYYESYRNYMSENEIGSIFSSGNDEVKKKTLSIIGIGANNGIVTGTARVINDFSQIDRLKENDILVTKFTDTGWTSKFAILSGIVTEYGGILCHAAIVSREYGIPAIVCCSDAMKKIKDGQTITINGTTGEVKIIK